MNECGTGDSFLQREFSNKKDAYKYFNKCKKDLNGWCGLNNDRCYLETLLVDQSKAEDSFGEIIESFECYK